MAITAVISSDRPDDNTGVTQSEFDAFAVRYRAERKQAQVVIAVDLRVVSARVSAAMTALMAVK